MARPGGSPRSASRRYHSAIAVAGSSARYSARTTSPCCQRPSVASLARPSSEQRCGAWRIHSPSTATVSTSMCWSGDAGVFQLADQLGDTAIVAAGKDLDGLFIVERFDRSREPDRDEVGSHDAREAIDHRAELDQPVGAGAAGRATTAEPVAHGARPRARGGGDLSVTELSLVMHAAGFSGKRGHGWRIPPSGNFPTPARRYCDAR